MKIKKSICYLLVILFIFMSFSSFSLAEATKITPQKAIITSSNVNMRNGPGIEYKAILQIQEKNTVVTVLEKDGNWYKINYNDGNIGWVIKDFIYIPSVATTVVESTASSNTLSSRSNFTSRADLRRTAIVNSAKSCLGIPYVWGGYSERGNSDAPDPENGLDCSGFVYYIYSIYNIKLNGARSTAASQALEGTQVNKDELKPGDLVFFQGPYDSQISHVAIYIGKSEEGIDQIIHASSYAGKVIISNLDDQPNYKTARRIIED